MVHLRIPIGARCAFLLLSLSLLSPPPANAATPIDFNSQIRPILSDRCYKCHGPDEQTREAGLRLDTEAGSRAWVDKAKGIRAISPSAPQKSAVVHRITSTDPNEIMPPADSNLRLAKHEIELLQQWIEQGARYTRHWAFTPIQRPTVPKAKTGWMKTPVDAFIWRELQKASLRPSSAATREILIRRVSLDLTGLPPTREQVAAFVTDSSPNAYEKVVERLLASPAYGERMANEWLDLARYADTYGYQSDVERDMSPWRDWVIQAFNRNLPYDQFIRWQLAGDLLPDATDEQILATAFNRLHRQTNEGGSIEEEFRIEYVADRVHTFGTAFLGLTMECARCHDHKYDPISQRDYYRLSAFFNNIDESGLYSHFTQATPSPTLLLYREGQKEEHARLKKMLVEKERQMERIARSSKAEFYKWLRTNRDDVSKPSPAAHFAFEETTGNVKDAHGAKTGEMADNPQRVTGRMGRALRFNGENSVVFKGLGEFKRVDPFSFALWLNPSESKERTVVFHRSRSWTDSGSRGYELILENGRPTFSLIHFWPGNAISIQSQTALATNDWSHLVITYDGSSRAAGLRLFLNGQPLPTTVVRDNLYKDILHRAEWGDMEVGNIHLTLGARFRDAGFKDGLIDEFAVYDRCLTAAEVVSLLKDSPALQKSKDALHELYLHRHHPEYQQALSELTELRRRENDWVNDIREIMAMREMAGRRPTHVLKRGTYDARGELVEPGTPESIFPFPKQFPQNRLGLAQWATDRKNPLTARVAVNRVWKLHFGRGLVTTPEDFGSQGQQPSHPELLDWLAADFIEHGWDLKRLHKMIVTSATYQQSSVGAADSLDKDPENVLLSRGPRHRLSAEQIRDAALASSGLLVNKIGGPSTKPYQPAGLWEQSGLSKTYKQDSGENLYRRSLYTFWRRTSPPPSMTVFDATSREVCVAKRETTATPLQALVLMNDPQFIEAARCLAEQLRSRNATVQLQIQEAFERLLGRSPQLIEVEILRRHYEDQLAIFKSAPGTAEQLLAVGEKQRAVSLPPEEVAALTLMVSTLINHDEFVMKR